MSHRHAHRAIAMALAAICLTAAVSSWASEPEPTMSDTASAVQAPTPLALRLAHPLEPPPPSPGTGLGWKVAALIAMAGCAAWAWRRGARGPIADTQGALRIVRRTPIGVRSELIVIEVDGQRLLLGVTPNAIQSLFVVPEEDTSPVLSSAETYDREEPQKHQVARRAPRAPATRQARAERAPARTETPEFVEEQARGLRRATEPR